MTKHFRAWDPRTLQLDYFGLSDAHKYANLLDSSTYPVHSYTGVKDRMGNLIYEKDLVYVDPVHIHTKMMELPLYKHAMVSYHRGAFWLNAKGWQRPTKGSTLFERYVVGDESVLYVVGNVHAANHMKRPLPKAV